MPLSEIMICRGKLDDNNEKFVVQERRRIANGPLIQRVMSALQEPENFGEDGLLCFEPGMSIDYMDAGTSVHHQVCLDCLWVKTFIDGKVKEMRSLCNRGSKEFMAIYVRHFGDPEKATG